MSFAKRVRCLREASEKAMLECSSIAFVEVMTTYHSSSGGTIRRNIVTTSDI